jgi:hypothetical protein
VFFRITDNLRNLTVRFVLGAHQICAAKVAMSRHIIAELDKVGIGIASATYDVVAFPPIEMRAAPALQAGPAA